MKYFVISDVHGFYSLLKQRLDEVGFDENNPNHCIISLGDMFDRGEEPVQMFEFFKHLVKINKIIMVRGNHEDLFYAVLRNKGFLRRDYHNRTYETFNDLCNEYFQKDVEEVMSDNYKELIEKFEEVGLFKLIDSMYDYVEIGKYIFVHGYIPTIEGLKYNPDWRKVADWWEAEWSNGQKLADELNIYEKGKTVVCGHFHSSYGNARKIIKKSYSKLFKKFNEQDFEDYEFEDRKFTQKQLDEANIKSIYDIYYGEHVIAIDACTAYSGKLNIFTFESDEEVITESKPYEHTYKELIG